MQRILASAAFVLIGGETWKQVGTQNIIEIHLGYALYSTPVIQKLLHFYAKFARQLRIKKIYIYIAEQQLTDIIRS